MRELVGKTIEEAIDAMLDEEADQLVGAGPYECIDGRAAYRACRYERDFTATSGQATLRMPKLMGTRFATAVIERRKRRETSVEEAIIEMHQAGASTRRIEDISEILWGADVSAGTVDSIAEVLPKARYRRCTVHFYRDCALVDSSLEVANGRKLQRFGLRYCGHVPTSCPSCGAAMHSHGTRAMCAWCPRRT